MEKARELANLIKESNHQAFNALYDICWEPMYLYASSLLRDNSAAQDLLQEVWIDYWKRRQEIVTDNIKGYLYKAIRYKCYNYLRNNKLPTVQLETANSVSIESSVIVEEDYTDLSVKLNSILNKLPPRCQEIFTLSRINQLDNKEISTELNISQRTVENQLSFALKRLRAELEIVRMLLCL